MQTPRRPLDGRRVAVTRPRGRDAELSRALARLGAVPVAAPLTKAAPPRSFAALDAALRRFSEHDACAFSSAAAVDAVFARARRLKLRLARPPRLLAVGPATARALAARGWRGALRPREETGAGLARALKGARGLRVFLPQAEGGRDEAAALLRRAGALVTRAAAYRLAPDERGVRALRAAAARGLDAACFAAPSAARAFRAALGARAQDVPAAAIGPTTSAELRRLGFRRVAQARRPEPAALAQALRIFFNVGDAPFRARRRARRLKRSPR